MKNRPSHVPEENVYDGMHWSIYIALAVAVIAVLLAVNEGITL